MATERRGVNVTALFLKYEQNQFMWIRSVEMKNFYLF